MDFKPVRDYCKNLSAHYNQKALDVDESLNERLQRKVMFTEEQVNFLRDLVVLGEREAVEVSGFDQASLLETAHQQGHKQGYLYALTYLINVAEDLRNGSDD